MAPHRDAQAGAAAAPGLLGELQGDVLEHNDIVPPDEPLLVFRQQGVQVDRAERDERAGGIRGRVRELGLVVRDELVAQVGMVRTGLETGDVRRCDTFAARQ